VTRIAVTVGKHQKLNLYPVAAAGRRWVALLTPGSARAMTFTAFSGKTELAHGSKLRRGSLTWLLPGQRGLVKEHRNLDRGSIPEGPGQHLSWSLGADAGPPGYCLDLNGDFGHDGFETIDCWSPDTVRSAGVKTIVHSAPARLARWLLGTAKPSVAYLKFNLAGGKTVHMAAVQIDSQKFFWLTLPHGQDVTSWAAFDKAGHKLYGGTGSPKIDPYVGPLSGKGWADNGPCALSTKACQRAHG